MSILPVPSIQERHLLLAGSAPWHRLRVGDHRVSYRAVEPDEAGESDARFLVARVVHRRDLERAVVTLE